MLRQWSAKSRNATHDQDMPTVPPGQSPGWRQAHARAGHASLGVCKVLPAGQEVKRPWKPHYYRHKGPLEPDRTILLMAVARELLTTWELTKDKANVDRHLAAVEKTYGAGSEQLVRTYMHWVRQNERNG